MSHFSIQNSRGSADDGRYGPIQVSGTSLRFGQGQVPTGTTARPDGMPYVGHTRCMANDASCQAYRAKGTDYCVGHLKSMTKAGTDAAE